MRKLTYDLGSLSTKLYKLAFENLNSIQGDQCFCLNENEVKYYLPPIPCQDNCTDTDNRNSCGFQIYSLNVTENSEYPV